MATKQELLDKIAKCEKAIAVQTAKKAKLEAQLAKLNKDEIVEAILRSGKTLEEVLEFVNS